MKETKQRRSMEGIFENLFSMNSVINIKTNNHVAKIRKLTLNSKKIEQNFEEQKKNCIFAKKKTR